MLTLHSPAKINLFLRVVRKRHDGYHELASLFQTIDLCDTLHFSFEKEDILTCTDPSIPTDNTNLIFKAAALFRQKTQRSFGLRIHLEKRIPSQAGLGGGSSNAATTLWALNELCNKPVPYQELLTWSAEIGSDVPFFLTEGTAYCTGRGEIIRPLSPLASTSLFIVKPPEGLPTPLVYQALDLSALPKRDPELALSSFLANNPVHFNDLEGPAFTLMPSLQNLKQRLLDSGFQTVLMCGSGYSLLLPGEGTVPQSLSCSPAAFLNRQPNRWYFEFLS